MSRLLDGRPLPQAGEKDRFLVVDINYFPGIAKMPGYEAVFADFLATSLERQRATAGSGNTRT